MLRLGDCTVSKHTCFYCSNIKQSYFNFVYVTETQFYISWLIHLQKILFLSHFERFQTMHVFDYIYEIIKNRYLSPKVGLVIPRKTLLFRTSQIPVSPFQLSWNSVDCSTDRRYQWDLEYGCPCSVLAVNCTATWLNYSMYTQDDFHTFNKPLVSVVGVVKKSPRSE